MLSGESVAVSGTIQVGVKSLPERAQLLEAMQTIAEESNKQDSMKLTKNEVYKELKLRGYNYGGLFQGVEFSDLKGKSHIILSISTN